MALVAAVLSVAGGMLLALLYGEACAGQRLVVAVFAAAMVAEAAGIPADAGLWTVGRPNVGFAVHVAGFAVDVAVGLVLIPPFGGVAWPGKALASALQIAFSARYSRGAEDG